MKILLYDPHPGLKSISVALPEIILLVARGLDGKEMEISDAIQIIQDAADTLVSNGYFCESIIEDHKDQNYLGLSLTENNPNGFPKHSFRVIRYKNLS